jgi:hypothetical protein
MRLLFLLSWVWVFIACGQNKSGTDDRPVAKVYDRSLMSSELAGVVPVGTNPQDSSLLVQAHIRRWVAEQLLMYEAERNIPKDANIDKMVRDYRASLVRFNFEENMIGKSLDSTVSESEVRRYYEENKDQFQLQTTILKCILIKVPAQTPQKELNQLWSSRNPLEQAKLGNVAKELAILTLLDREKWYRLDEIAAILPQGTLTSDNVGSRREGTLSEGDFRYYYRILESVRGKETAPFDYVKGQANKLILHRRKQELLTKWNRELYDNELRRGNIKIF